MYYAKVCIAALLIGGTAAAQTVEQDFGIAAARAAARADRNAEAAQLFSEAIARSPLQRRDLLQELADQLLYSQRPAAAIPLYSEVLTAPRNGDERRRALKGLGLAYLRIDQPTLARPLFEQVVREQPDDEDASRNLGRALAWGGRQRAAQLHLRGHVSRNPNDGESRVLLAQAQLWMGRADEALASLDGVDRDDARSLRTQIARSAAPETQLALERSAQSDNVDIQGWRASHSLRFADGRGTVGVRVDRVEYERVDGTDSAQVTRPMLLGRFRFSDALEWSAEIGRERMAPRAGATTDFTAFNTWLTWWTNDLVRLDASSGRADFDNLRSLRLGLTHLDTALSVDVTPTEQQRYSARLQHMTISDGNRRELVQAEGEYRLRTHPDIWVGARYTHFDFARQFDNGYYNPQRFDSVLGTVRVQWRPEGAGERWEVGFRGAWGREHAGPDGGKRAYDVSLRGWYRIDAAMRLELRAQRFSSRTSTASGFARSTLGASLERSW